MTQQRSIHLGLLLALALGLAANGPAREHDDQQHDGNDGRHVEQASPRPQAQARPQAQPRPQARPKAPAPAPARQPRQPLVINMGHPSSGSRDRNYPRQGVQAQPSWGHIQRVEPAAPVARNRAAAPVQRSQPQPRMDLKAYNSPGVHAAEAAHHHPYTQGYVRKKLERLGVHAEPAYITNRSEIINTDRRHSTIRLPTVGLGNAILHAALIGPVGVTAALIGAHMALVNRPEWRGRMEGFNRDESREGRYYWHHDDGFDFCHYRDDSGYHWYGWYLGSQFFWTREFNGRSWWYDTASDRWDFYNDGFWWWQDPYHVGELYCYNDGAYIPANSAQDQVVVTHPDAEDMKAFNSPDGTRTVKLMAGSADAFLYDAAADPAFAPVYLASGVQSVEFSNTANGRPLEVILRLSDGSFDLFDSDGRPYGPEQSADPNDDPEPQAQPVAPLP